MRGLVWGEGNVKCKSGDPKRLRPEVDTRKQGIKIRN